MGVVGGVRWSEKGRKVERRRRANKGLERRGSERSIVGPSPRSRCKKGS